MLNEMENFRKCSKIQFCFTPRLARNNRSLQLTKQEVNIEVTNKRFLGMYVLISTFLTCEHV